MHNFSHQTSIPGAVIPGFGSSVFSADGETLLFTSKTTEGKVSPKRGITAYDVNTKMEKFHVEGHTDQIV